MLYVSVIHVHTSMMAVNSLLNQQYEIPNKLVIYLPFSYRLLVRVTSFIQLCPYRMILGRMTLML